jgi:hypothetical protein
MGRKARNKLGEEISSLCEAFADNLTVLLRLVGNALQKVLAILEDFSKLSGLAINREKNTYNGLWQKLGGGRYYRGHSSKKRIPPLRGDIG